MKPVALPVMLTLVLAVSVVPARAEVTDDDVQTAINRGVEYLLGLQRDTGLFSETGEMRWDPAGRPIMWGNDCWVLVGLAFADLSMNRDTMKNAFDAIIKLEIDQTYAVAPRIIALSRLLHKLDRERAELARVVIKKDLTWLIQAQGAEGQWDYNSLDGKSSTHWDFSNTQMALLALSEAVMAGFEPPNEPFIKAQNLYLERQLPDGGWNYGSRGGFQAAGNENGSYGSMTAAAVASLFITRDYLYRGLGCPCSSGTSKKLRPKNVDVAIEHGLAWLSQEFVVDTNPRGNARRWCLYWLYSCERVGLATGYKYFGTHNWYAEGAEHLVRNQGGRGSWHLGGEDPSDTVYAICFLAKGRAPILMNKLKFDGDWDNHPRDAANLAKYVGKLKEQLIQWQIVTLDVPVDELHDAPILYITAETTIPLTDEQKAKLRRFTDTGGTILFEASCGNRQVRQWWETLCKELWPEWEFKTLDREHPVYTSDQKISRPLPLMLEMHDGMRSIIFFATRDISCPWNTWAISRNKDLFDFGANLYAYATDKGPLRARLARKHVVSEKRYTEPVNVTAAKPLTVARLKHGGDYYVGQDYDGLGILIKALQEKASLAVNDAKVKAAAELQVGEVQVAYLTGRQGVSLGEADVKALAEYVKAGGFLLAEAAMGDTRFDAALRALVSQMGAELKELPLDDAVLTGRMAGARGYAIEAVKFKPTLMAQRVGQQVPQLEGIYLGGKLVGLYSPFDMMYTQTGMNAWGCRGYREEDARALLTNIFLFIAGR